MAWSLNGSVWTGGSGGLELGWKCHNSVGSLHLFWQVAGWGLMHVTLNPRCWQMSRNPDLSQSHNRRPWGRCESPFFSWHKPFFVVSSVLGILTNHSTSTQEVTLCQNTSNCVYPAPNRHGLPVGSSKSLPKKPNPSWDEDGKLRVLIFSIFPVEPLLKYLVSVR